MDRGSQRPQARLAALRPIARGPAAGRLGWGLADQAVSSITNFALGIVVARSLGPTEFGAFSLAWVTYGVALNLSRGLATDPLTADTAAHKMTGGDLRSDVQQARPRPSDSLSALSAY